MIHYIILTFGFAEDQRVCDMIWYHVGGFKTKTDAIRSLSGGFLEWFKKDNGYSVELHSKCCKSLSQKFGQAAEKFQYCPNCGRSLFVENNSPDEEEISDWLKSLSGYTLDGFHDDIMEDHCGWQLNHASNLFGVDLKEVVIIDESAEKTLARVALKDQAEE